MHLEFLMNISIVISLCYVTLDRDMMSFICVIQVSINNKLNRASAIGILRLSNMYGIIIRNHCLNVFISVSNDIGMFQNLS